MTTFQTLNRVKGGTDYSETAGWSLQVLNNATVTASGGSNVFSVIGARRVDLVVFVNGTFTSGATITFNITGEYVEDSSGAPTTDVGTVVTYAGGTISATSTGDLINVADAGFGDYVKVSWTVAGTTPSITGVFAKLVAKK